MELLNTFLTIGAIIVGIVAIVVFSRRGAFEASNESNEILRKLLDDQKNKSAAQDDEILKLRERQHTLGNDMQKLQLQFEAIKQERKYLTQLITLALAEHFAANPEAAKAAEALVAGSSMTQGRREDHG